MFENARTEFGINDKEDNNNNEDQMRLNTKCTHI